MKRTIQSLATALSLLAFAALARAAEADPAPDTQARPSTGNSAQFSAVDVNGPLVRWLSVGNTGEIQLGQFAQQHSENEQVRQFAKMMVEEHTQFAHKLQQSLGREAAAAPQAAPANSAQSSNRESSAARRIESDVSRPAGAPATVGVAGPVGQANPAGPTGMAGALDLLRLKEKCGQNKVALTQRELEQHRGAAFDQAYIGQQIVAHTEMLADLQAVRAHATGNLQPVIDAGIETTQKHLDHARKLMRQLASSEAPQSREQPQE